MNFLKISSLFLFVFLIASCGGDDDTCAQADWVGTYTGTVACDGVSQAATITISASGSTDILIEYKTTDGSIEAEYSPITLGTTCTLEETQVDLDGNMAEFNGTLSDGNTIDITVKLTIAGTETTCVHKGTK